VRDHLGARRRRPHQLLDLVEAGHPSGLQLLDRGLEVVRRAPQLDVRAEQRPVREAWFRLVGKADAAGVEQPPAGHPPVVLHVRVRRDDADRVDAGREVGHARLGRRHGHALLVASRRAVAEERLPQPGDVHAHAGLHAAEVLGEPGTLVLRVLPARDLGVDQLPFDELPLRVPAHQTDALSPRLDERDRLRGERPPGEVAAGDEQIGLLPLDLGEHRFERGGVAVHVRDCRDAHAA
jgi:hypothetical protein